MESESERGSLYLRVGERAREADRFWAARIGPSAESSASPPRRLSSPHLLPPLATRTCRIHVGLNPSSTSTPSTTPTPPAAPTAARLGRAPPPSSAPPPPTPTTSIQCRPTAHERTVRPTRLQSRSTSRTAPRPASPCVRCVPLGVAATLALADPRHLARSQIAPPPSDAMVSLSCCLSATGRADSLPCRVRHARVLRPPVAAALALCRRDRVQVGVVALVARLAQRRRPQAAARRLVRPRPHAPEEPVEGASSSSSSSAPCPRPARRPSRNQGLTPRN